MELGIHRLEGASLNVLKAHADQELKVGLFDVRLGDIEVVLLSAGQLLLTEDDACREMDFDLLDSLGDPVSRNVLDEALGGRGQDDLELLEHLVDVLGVVHLSVKVLVVLRDVPDCIRLEKHFE